MKQLLLLLFVACSMAFASIGQETTPINLGFSEIIPSAEMGVDQQVNIYLPGGYNPDSASIYPVIYLLDGGIDEDFIHIAGLVQFSSFSWVNYLQSSILVGIVSTDRKRDLTFKASPDFKWPEWLKGYSEAYKDAGGSGKFMNYIEKELQPYIESHYKTNGTKTLIGQSLAGLFATEILLKKPNLFQNYIIMSPSLWWDNESLLQQATTLLLSLPETPLNIYVAVGKEGKAMEDDAKNLAKVIRKTKKKNTVIHFEFLPKEDHGTILHQAVGNAFELFQTEK